MNVISYIFGIIALIIMVVGLVPFLGFLNWIVVILAGIGLLFGSLSKDTDGRNLNAIVIIISVIRLWLGGGIF